jgi:ATP-dependent DNA ligase
MGRSIFKELLYRRGNPFFYAFDLLWLNGRDLRQLPVLERKRMLRRLIRDGGHILYAHHVKARARSYSAWLAVSIWKESSRSIKTGSIHLSQNG